MKMALKINVQTHFLRSFSIVFFGESQGKCGQAWGEFEQKLRVMWFDLKQCGQVVLKSFFFSFFRARLVKFGQKCFAPPKICLLLHLSLVQ